MRRKAGLSGQREEPSKPNSQCAFWAGRKGALGHSGRGGSWAGGGWGSVCTWRVLGKHQMVLSRKGGIAFLKDHSATLHSDATDQRGRWRNGGLDTAAGGGDAEA